MKFRPEDVFPDQTLTVRDEEIDDLARTLRLVSATMAALADGRETVMVRFDDLARVMRDAATKTRRARVVIDWEADNVN